MNGVAKARVWLASVLPAIRLWGVLPMFRALWLEGDFEDQIAGGSIRTLTQKIERLNECGTEW